MKQTLFTSFPPFTGLLDRNRLNGRSFHQAGRALLIVLASSAVSSMLAANVPLAFRNPGMEEGTGKPAAWNQGPPVAGVQYLWDQQIAHAGKASLCLKKTAPRYFPIAQWNQSASVEPSSTPRKFRVRCWVKAEAVAKAIIDVPYEDAGGKPGHTWAVFLGQKQATEPVLTHDWKLYEGIVEVPANTIKLGVAFQIYGPGTVWFDDLEVAWVSESRGPLESE